MVTVSDETIVADEGVTVTKAFDWDGFPVPAVTFRIKSDRSDPVDVRIVDEIPEEYGIEQIGFHPEYGSEHWTATGEGVVRFERTVDAGEAFTTVYGVKMTEEEEETPFLGAPTIDVDPEDQNGAVVEDVIPRESSDVVRDLADGDRDSIPGLDDEPQPAETAAEESEAVAETATDAVAGDDAEILDAGEAADAESEPEVADDTDSMPAEDELEATADPIEATASDVQSDEPTYDEEILEGTEEAISDTASTPEERDDEQIAGAEEKTAADPFETTDVTTESSETETEPPQETADEMGVPTENRATDATSASDTDMTDEFTESTTTEPEPTPDTDEQTAATDDTGVGGEVPEEGLAARLAAEIRAGTADEEDLAVIREAAAEPTESDDIRLEHLQARVSDLEAYTDALEEFLDENGRGRKVLDDVESTVADLATDVEDIASRVDAATGEREALRERVDTVSDDLTAVDDVAEKIDRLAGDLEAIEERVTDGEEARMEVASLEDELEDLEDAIDDVGEDVAEIKDWRSQLSDLFS
ncbi:hypothetical protein HLASA_1316 [Halanaeroarchaeum sulfurireducens]|uniref:Coiled coil protein n=1 Tax=Halanaeroarchaeum sulfurireducens TaxID=1604004 RepID=A0A0N9MIY3_9EURY|nr:hypothetical protein HLASA_1316 [Halanaeroarchaeum sulfurireducens]